MKKLFSLLCVATLLLSFNRISAQHTLSGKVLAKGSGIEKASVSLYNSQDTSLVKMQLSDVNGAYLFGNIFNGTYFITISLNGYTDAASELIEVNGNNVQINEIRLAPYSKEMTSVIVQAKKPLIEMKADKMVVNVDASPSNAGSNALEVLEKSPGVTVDKDGNISLKGKQGVMVLLDGRPSYVSGAELANMLRGMTAAQLDQIEIMTNPPAKYDAAGDAGVINIKTKKIRTKGFNGNINSSYGQGVYARAGSSVNLNYRKDKINLFGSTGYNYRGGYQQFDVYRNILNPSGVIKNSFIQHAFMPDSRNSFNGKLGLDYDFTKRTSASLVLNAFSTKMHYENNISSSIYDENRLLESSNNGQTIMDPHVTNYSANTSIRHQFDSNGTELTLDAAYVNFKDDHKQRFYNSFYDKDGTQIAVPDTLLGKLPRGYKVYAFKADLIKPLKNKASLETGLKASYVTSDNNIRFDSLINGSLIKDNSRTNHFIYKENIFAAYINYSTPLSSKLKLQAGLRYEYTEGKGNSLTNQENFDNKYGKLFPTLFLSYEADQDNQFNINYGKRISRPQYKDMNPFVFIIDRYTFQSGNPYLKPEFSQKIEVSHLYKKALTTTVHFMHTKGAISEIIETDEITKEGTLINRNIATKNQFGIGFNFYKPVSGLLTVVANANIYNNRFQGILKDSAIDVNATSGNFYAALQFKFKKGWDAEINGFFNTRGIDGVAVDAEMGMFTLAASKEVLKNKGKISLNVRDPFQLARYQGHTRYANVDASITSRWDNRSVNLTFNYRFGKQFKTNKRVDESASEEQKRIGG